MVWDVHARREHRHDGLVTHVRARWTGLDSIQDVSLDCGRGVNVVGAGDYARREMNAFSKPIKGAFRWAEDAARAEVILTWTDMGEPCEERILLTESPQHHILPPGLRKLLHGRTDVGAVLHPGEGETAVGRAP
jgi:hypothetical protein